MTPAHIGTIAAKHRASGGGDETTYAYWRVLMTVAQPITDGYMNLGKVEFLKWGVRTGLAANVVATFADESFPGRGPEHLFDANPVGGNQWTSNGSAPPHYVGVQYSSPIEVDTVRITPSAEAPNTRSPNTFTIQGSSDGTTWVDLYTASGVTDWGAPHSYTVGDFGPPPVIPGHAFWRIYCTALNGDVYFGIQEIEGYESTGGNVFDPTMVTSASSSYGTNTPDKAIDGDYLNYASNCWLSAGGALPQWWSIDCNVNKDLTSVTIFPQNYSGGPARGAKDFLIQYSDDLGITWNTVKTVTGESSWVAGSGINFSW